MAPPAGPPPAPSGPRALSPATRAWFTAAFDTPTPAQEQAWATIAGGDHALVVAPTGSGKTLAAFLWAIDRLLHSPQPPPQTRCRVVYISPLKALAADVQRNLTAPLAGIRAQDPQLRELRVAMRTGDTPPAERRRMARRPPDVLVTTPESLYLLLTSGARESLRGVETVIVDEVHAVAGTKRGAHLAVTLERLDELVAAPVQRIGLSATVRPTGAVARFLTGVRQPSDGGRPVQIIQPAAHKTLRLDVEVPVPDLSDPPDAPHHAQEGASPGTHRASVWPHVEERIVDLVATHRSTIVFTNSRRTAERLTARVNEVWSRRRGEQVAAGQPAAQLAGQSGTAITGGDDVLARTHHGSMSPEERREVEEALKGGTLRAVVATATLELGIDMGFVELVVHVGTPPSVAATVQRTGRGGHQVGAPSHGVVLPLHRGDLVVAALTARRAVAGEVEQIRPVRNPLDVLAQQVVATLVADDWRVADLAAMVRRAAPFAELGEHSLRAVLDMLAGRYPSEDFANLRPRIVWDRHADVLQARPGALRLATTSGGTIPDRGLYGVFLAAGEGATATQPGRGGRRVGELDEEMVHESRVGDAIVLGSSTWRIEEITPDRVLVSPVAGVPGRLPFWKGEGPGRPAELGRALGAFVREVGHAPVHTAEDRLTTDGLDTWARQNLLAYLTEQREHAGVLSDDRTVVVEHFRDELGDWRVVIHSPLGARVHTPWALVIAARLKERHGLDVAALGSDDGIVLRLPSSESAGPLPMALADLFLDPGEVRGLVVTAVSGSAQFAARFRESAARALLLPRYYPQRRQPLWQQRHRAAQLLGAIERYPDFPIALEALRECLQDDFDTTALTDLMRDVAAGEVRVVQVATDSPSPFARSLLLGYLGAHLYDTDAPLAERRAAALALDPVMLREIIGDDGDDLSQLLDPHAVATVTAAVSLRAPLRDVEDVADRVRRLGPVTTAGLSGTDEGDAQEGEEEVDEQVSGWLAELHRAGRVIAVDVGGEQRWAAVEDAARLRDGLGVTLPAGLAPEVLEELTDPLGDLVRRFAATNGPFRITALSRHLGLEPGELRSVVARLRAAGVLVAGRLLPGPSGGPDGEELCDAQVLQRIRRLSLTRLREQVQAVPTAALGRFLPAWQHAAGSGVGVDEAAWLLAGARLPASVLESLVLPARVTGYEPRLLDELVVSGELLWCGAGRLGDDDGHIVLAPADSPELLPAPSAPPATELHEVLLDELRAGGQFFRQLVTACRGRATQVPAEGAVLAALWDLVWSGHVTNDTLTPLRAVLSGATTRAARRTPRPRSAGRGLRGLGLTAGGTAAGAPAPAAAAGRWSVVARPTVTDEQYALRTVGALLERHGVLTRDAAGLEQLPGGFSGAYPVLRRLAEAGHVRRGYFVAGLGAAQFALPPCVELLREHGREPADARALLLAATDPANPYGAALRWPAPVSVAVPGSASSGRPARVAGAVVVIVAGELVLHVSRGGRSVLSFSADGEALRVAADELASAVAHERLGRVVIQRLGGAEALSATGALAEGLAAAGFLPTPRGLVLRRGAAPVMPGPRPV